MLRDARLQILSYQQPHVPVFVAHAFSPAGALAAGRFGTGMLSVASSELGGLDSMRQAWMWASEEADRCGQRISRDNWRVTMTIHLADSKREAIEDIRGGVRTLNREYFGTLGVRFEPGQDSVDALVGRPGVAIGTPDDAIAAIEEVIEASGGVGGILINHREWASSTDKMLRSYELFARHVMPRFQGQAQPVEANLDWAREGHRTLFRSVRAAQRKAFEDAGIEVPEVLRQRPRDPEHGG
jgi:limonene 1,2-monooxygenase